jgi:MOSC domain-containing protein YiiM
MRSKIIALSSDTKHRFSKQPNNRLRLIAGLGVLGDAHYGATVQHLSRVAKNPAAPNLRQVHLIHAELLEELSAKGFAIAPGAMGENITTSGIDLLGLSQDTRLRLGREVIVEITGLRNPCHQLNAFAPGLMEAVLERAADGSLIRKCGVMAIVVQGGELQLEDAIEILAIPNPTLKLGVV